jgi:hypothetical protein
MCNFNTIHKISSITSRFIYNTILYLTKISSNCFQFFNFEYCYEQKNVKKEKKFESDRENQNDSIDELVTKFSSKRIIKKTKSHNDIYYSYTYNNLSKLVPPNSPSKAILNELIKNKNNDIMACCNPYCKKKIDVPIHLAFDGYYCTTSCRKYVANNMYLYWNQL